MKRLLVILAIVLLLFSPKIVWLLKDTKPLTIHVIDKTVPTKDYREHNGLFQVLDYEKVVDPSGELYDIGKDYYGFDPYNQAAGEPYTSSETPDVIYVTDTYGVFEDDLEDGSTGKRSRVVDGGLGLLEWNAIMANKTENTTLLAEFNSFASPTEPSVSAIMQKNLSVQWDGWIGRYFPNFKSDEVPAWLIHDYEEQSGQPWSFSQDGLAFVHTSGEVVVLDNTSSTGGVELELTEEGQQRFPSVVGAPYLYWFDIVEPIEGAQELARYSFQLTDKGTSRLREAGIPTDFPAIIHNAENKTYYFAGDYADFDKRAFTKWQGLPKVYPYFATDLAEFYWKTYFPLLSHIIQDIYDEKEQ